MQRLGYIFPGQGSQFPGMGKDLVEEYPVADDVFQRACEVLDFDMKKLCFSGPEEELKKTINTQPAILTTSVAAYRVLKENGAVPDIVAGHSLGEYSALVAAGVLSFEDALQLVRKRGQYMQESVALGEGGMVAVIGLNPEQVKGLCAEVKEGFVEPANYNCPGQIVISGESDALKIAAKKLEEAGAKRVIPLPVSAPFHCKLLKGAADKLENEIKHLNFNKPEIPIISNYDAQTREDPEEIRTALIKQVSSPVLWEKSIEKMLEMNIGNFVEVGPGKVLRGFMRRIDRKAKAFSAGDREGIETTLSRLEVAEEVKDAAK